MTPSIAKARRLASRPRRSPDERLIGATSPGRFRLRRWPLAKIVLGVTAAVWLLTLTPLLRQVEAWTVDLRLTLLAPSSPARDDIALVAVDEAALAALPYRSPIDRGFLADTLEPILAAGPRAVGIDILIDRASEADKDARFLALLEGAAIPIVLAHGGREDGLTADQSAFLDAFTANLIRGDAVFESDALDGRLRTVGAVRGGDRMTFAGALARAVTPAPVASEPFFLAPATVDTEAPAFRTFPARLLAGGGADASAWLRDRVVLVGAVLPGDDRHEITRGPPMAGIEVHGHILARLLDGYQPRPAPAWAGPLLILLATTAGTLLVAWRGPAWLRIGLGGVVVLGALGAAMHAAWSELILPVAGPVEAALIAVASTRLRIAAADRAQRRFLHRAFGKYIAPALVERLLAQPDDLRIGGERREITALYTDLEGFTALTEALPPEELIGLLNPYLDGICRTVVDHGGIVDKLVGDAVVAMFNAPVDLAGHQSRAVAAALAIDAFSKDFLEQRGAALGRPLGKTRIGVATGVVTVGNFGGEVLFDYTAQGPAMNLGARLEAANRDLGTTICVAQSTAVACPEYRFRELGTVRAKGFAAPVPVCTPVLQEEEEDERRQQKGAA